MACNRISNPLTAGTSFPLQEQDSEQSLFALTNEPLLAGPRTPRSPRFLIAGERSKRIFLHEGVFTTWIFSTPSPCSTNWPANPWKLRPARHRNGGESPCSNPKDNGNMGKWSLDFRLVAQSQSHCRRALRNPFLRIRRDQSCRRSLSMTPVRSWRTPSRFLGILYAAPKTKSARLVSSRIPVRWSMERDLGQRVHAASHQGALLKTVPNRLPT